jgi:hypothetical protein
MMTKNGVFLFSKETEVEKRKKKEGKKKFTVGKNREGKKKRKGYYFGGKPFTKLTFFEATVLWKKTPQKVTAPLVSLQSDSELM